MGSSTTTSRAARAVLLAAVLIAGCGGGDDGGGDGDGAAATTVPTTAPAVAEPVGPDPCTLVLAEDLTAIFGIPAEGSTTETLFGTICARVGTNVIVSVQLLEDFDQPRAETDRFVPVAGVGDEAYFLNEGGGGSGLYVRTGETFLLLLAEDRGDAEAFLLDQALCEQLAALVLPRVP